jgi:uncharacterized metal-binding protein YceD (DUF177 family)
MKNPLIINRVKIKEGSQKFYQEVSAEDLEIKKLLIIGPIKIDVELSKNGDMIVVAGTVNFRVKLCCVNCLESYEKDFSEKIYQEYVRGTKPVATPGGRIEDADFSREYYADAYFDMTPIIRDTVQLAIPMASWCRDDCPGVCV